jgi:hypothetical protein
MLRRLRRSRLEARRNSTFRPLELALVIRDARLAEHEGRNIAALLERFRRIGNARG